MSNHRRQIIEQRMNGSVGESFIAQAALECLDRVRNPARINAPKRFDKFYRELRHADSLSNLSRITRHRSLTCVFLI